MRRARLVAPLVLGLCLGLQARAANDPEVAALLERAQFWQGRSRDDLAREALDKVFRLAPDHPDALLLQARMELRANRDTEAAATLARLRRAHPRHPGVAQLDAVLRVRGPDKERLRMARQLSRAGRNDEAVAAFRALFPDGIADDELALEFAQVLGGTRGGWEPARVQLAGLERRHPGDPRYRVALAAHLSTREPVAPETLRTLRELTGVPSVARQAREAWRRAVLSMDAGEAAVPALREYIAANPGETAVSERLAKVLDAVRVRNDPGFRARREGWAALEAGRLDEADARIAEAVARHPDDAESVGALGVLRMRQERHAEALAHLRRARELEAAANRAKWDSLIAEARYWGLLRDARVARDANDTAAAEARLQEARALAPRRADAHVELARLLLAAGRDAEAETLLAQLTAEQRREMADAIARLRAGRLRDRAKALEAQKRADDAIAVLEEGAALDALDPWLRHDLARLYAARGDVARGRALFAELLRRRPRDGETLHAFALFLSSAERESEALRVLEDVPGGERSAGATRLQRRLWAAVQGRRAAAFAARGQGEQAGAIIAALRDAARGDRALALEFAGALDRMGADDELRTLLDRLASDAPTPGEAEAIAELRVAMALRRAEKSRAAGDPGAALRELDSQAAARMSPGQARRYRYERARALAAAGRREEAAAAWREILREAPGEREAELALVATLMELDQHSEARSRVQHVLRLDPNEPQALAAAATLAARAGRLDEALAHEQRALGAEGSGEAWRYRRLAEWLDEQQAWTFGAIDALQRSGTRGKSRMSARELPIAWRQGWGAEGRWFARVAPTRVDSGSVDLGDLAEANSFGSSLLCVPLCAHEAPAGAEQGVAFALGFERGGWKAEIGTSPIGFPVVNLLGGVAHKGEVGPLSYTLELARRPVTASLLSYAGTRDPNTGRTWGGVTSTGVRLNLSRDSGGEFGAWGLAGLYRLSGREVLDNDKAELMGGVYRRFVNEPDRQLTAGVAGILWRFGENAGEYTLGHGGYYSPGSYRSIALPVTYAQRGVRTSFSLRASVSVAWSQSRTAPFFPTDAELQARAEALVPTTFVDAFHAGGARERSIGRSFAAAVEHQLAPSLFVGARMELERSTNYTPNRFLLYVRVPMAGDAARPVTLPPEPGLPGLQY